MDYGQELQRLLAKYQVSAAPPPRGPAVATVSAAMPGPGRRPGRPRFVGPPKSPPVRVRRVCLQPMTGRERATYGTCPVCGATWGHQCRMALRYLREHRAARVWHGKQQMRVHAARLALVPTRRAD